MVPNGWEVKKLEDVVSKTRKITYGIVVPGPYEPNGNLMIRAKDYSFGWQPIESIYRVSDKMHQSYKRSQVRKGDVLLTIVGSIGNTAIVPEDLEGANITQQTARLSFDEHDANFFYSVMSSETGKKEIYRYAKSGVQPSLNLADIAKFKVPVPPFPEQQKIAKILSTWDKAISTTERLIENSTQQKKALMQQLLTGKKRLLDDEGKRFESEWEEVKLGKVADVRDGTHDSPEFIDVGYPLITSKNLLSSGRLDLSNVKFISEEDYLQINKRSGVNDGDILFGMIGTIGNPVKVKSSNYAIKNVALIKETGGLLNSFLIYYLSSHDIDKQIHRLNAGGTQKFVALGVLRNLVIRLPTQQEQQKIATVLTNADKEIELLEQQLADLQQEKKALMQVLLTGKKRVVVDGEVA